MEKALAAAKDTRIAETLQSSMLQEPPIDKFSGIEVKTLYAAALVESNVGGDLFDAFALSGGQAALVVGDVSGFACCSPAVSNRSPQYPPPCSVRSSLRGVLSGSFSSYWPAVERPAVETAPSKAQNRPAPIEEQSESAQADFVPVKTRIHSPGSFRRVPFLLRMRRVHFVGIEK